MAILECHECGKRCSPEFQLQGFVLRGLVECPECFEKRSKEIDRLRKEILELKRSLEYHCQLEQYGEFRGFPEEMEESD